MPRKGNRCTTMVNFQLTPLEATALQAVVVHLPVFSPESRQFRTFGGGETIGPTSGVAIGLGHPVADRLRRRFKLAGEVLGGTSGSDQRDQLFAKLRRIRSSGSWHRGLLLPQGLGVHESGSGPVRRCPNRCVSVRSAQHWALACALHCFLQSCSVFFSTYSAYKSHESFGVDSSIRWNRGVV